MTSEESLKRHRGFAGFNIKRLAPQGRLERKILQSITRIIELGVQERGKLGFLHCDSTSVMPSCHKSSLLCVTFSSLALLTHFNERDPYEAICFWILYLWDAMQIINNFCLTYISSELIVDYNTFFVAAISFFTFKNHNKKYLKLRIFKNNKNNNAVISYVTLFSFWCLRVTR